MSLTHRERFRRLMHYQTVDRGVHWDFGFLDETMTRWHQEGLPDEVFGADDPGGRMGRISQYFGVDPAMHVPVSIGIHPGFPYELVEERERTVLYRDGNGCVVEEAKEGQRTIPHVVEQGLKSREDWESKGKKSTWQKAGEIVRQLSANDGYSLPEAVRKQVIASIKDIVD